MLSIVIRKQVIERRHLLRKFGWQKGVLVMHEVINIFSHTRKISFHTFLMVVMRKIGNFSHHHHQKRVVIPLGGCLMNSLKVQLVIIALQAIILGFYL